MPLSLNSRHCGNVYIIECRGRIAAGEETASLASELERVLREFTRIVLQVKEVDRIDSLGMGLLIRYAVRTRRRGGDIRLAEPATFVERLLHATKLSSILRIFPGEEAAIVSFLKERSPLENQKAQGPKVLFLDGSPDLCAFVRVVLNEHGCHVVSTNRFYDAKLLLQVDQVDYILLGPHASHQSPDFVAASLIAASPKAKAVQLGKDFPQQDAREAGEILLRILQGSTA